MTNFLRHEARILAPQPVEHVARLWPALGLAAAFIVLGAVFIGLPDLGAAVFGLAAPAGEARGFLSAIGIRDLALGVYIASLAIFAGRRAVAVLLTATLMIPAGDVILLSLVSGSASAWHFALHGLSAAVIGLVALSLLRRGAA
ncbi:DUF4267 domain-containing protein [Roseomonas sp. E05]|uniref:DUF4267 domain-containing protein n=1 Tax=Roseomonas sp. E05 TaxID=3046310 RepID=UPI0024BADED5|nr:DUF4267 domain-containing protein [Roseomonas sp. E05]MDJ0388303.1 DUF4267 domain-containing protein [Roseomonas sp. E05]